ncbi:MAG TPA: ABC transporter permease [Puia sp.]|nr:ABC transporter permease [Puia sp.]
MFRNYIRIAFRYLRQNRTFSLINVVGLAIGLTCCILISLFVYDELNYDTYPAQARDIFRVGINVLGNGNVATYPNVDVAVGEGIKTAFPEVRGFVRISSRGETFMSNGNRQFKEYKIGFVDSGFLSIFSIPLREGDAAGALVAPNSIVIDQAFAKKYFGEEEPLGKSLKMGNAVLKVTGVMERIPSNSHFHFDAVISMSTMHLTEHTWSNIGFYTYLLLNKGADPKKIEAKMPELVAKYVVPEVQHDMGVSLAEAQKSVNTFLFFLQPLTDIHLHSNTKYELEANGDVQYVYIFGALAIFILLLACVNFTNLATACSSNRSKEVGIRKVMGSLKNQLISQFLTESIVLTFVSLLLAFGLVLVLLPFFNQLSGKDFHSADLLNYKAITALAGLGLLVGICAGWYPAFSLSSFNVIRVLKGGAGVMPKVGHFSLRSGLVVFQFFVSTTLIIATFIVYHQLHFMQDRKLGYDKEQVLYVRDTYLLGARDVRYAFRQQLAQDSRVINASIGTNVPCTGDMDGTQVYPKEKEANEGEVEIHSNIYHVDYDYISTLGMKIVRGRNFSRDFSSDSFATVINEAAVRDLGWIHTDPIGKTIVTSGRHEYKVIGVVADFNYSSLRQKIAPLMMRLDRPGSGLIIKVNAASISSFVKDLERRWKALSPDAPFSWYFLNDQFAHLYATEQRTGQIFGLFALLAIVIACLGLFGLAAFLTEQRAKEIGIRKVLGASVRQVLVLVTKEFLLLVGIAIIVAVPFTWWAMHVWLQDFAYRVSINGWIFFLAGVITVLIALITVSFRAIRAARANPVRSLKAE